MDSNNLLSNNNQNNIIDNQNNENICKEHDSARHQKSNDKECLTNGTVDETQTVTKKKSKKRQLPELTETEEQPAAKTKKTSVLVETNICKDKIRKVSFYWRLAILEIVQNKGEISLKKLQKKVVSLYLLHSVKVLDRDKAIAKFHKKLKKIPEIAVSGNIVKLVKPCNLYTVG